MDTYTLKPRAENRPPTTGGMARRSSFLNFPPGVPFSSELQNDPVPVSKNPAENSNVELLNITPHSVEVVQKGEYSPEVGKQMYDWFCSKEKARISYDTITWKNGEVVEKERKIPNPPPHFSEFARTIGVTHATLKRWAKAHAEFAEFYDACQDIIQEFYIDNGVTGEYAGQFAIFAAKNTTKMKDVQVNRNENINMKDVLDALEKNSKGGAVNPYDGI